MRDLEIIRHNLNVADEFSEFPFGREAGQRLGAVIQNLEDNALLTLDFERVIAVGISFLRPALGGLRAAIVTKRVNTPLIAFINTKAEDLEWTLDFQLPGLPVEGIALGNDGEVSFMTKKPHLAETFAAAKDLSEKNGAFSNQDVAELLGTKLPAMDARLNTLVETGSTTRWRDPSAKHGKRYAYRTVLDQDLA